MIKQKKYYKNYYILPVIIFIYALKFKHLVSIFLWNEYFYTASKHYIIQKWPFIQLFKIYTALLRFLFIKE